MNSKQAIEHLLKPTGVTLGGNNPWDIQVHNEKLFDRILSQGSLGFGESYMDGWWDCESIDQMLTKIFRSKLQDHLKPWRMIIPAVKAQVSNLQSKKRAFKIGEAHYDIGNDLYQTMLDDRMVYTCGYWKDIQLTPLDPPLKRGELLNKAQEAKLDLVCKKIGLKPGMKVLDIGCGWGSFAKFAAEKYGANVVGVTVSKEQIKLGNKLCEGLPVELRLQDYRQVNEKFDRVISLGMIEHVGYKNFPTYMQVAHRALKDDGIFLLHTIGGNKSVKSTDPWIDKYIFPNSMLPSQEQLTNAAQPFFVMEDWHNFGPDYDKTLLAWFENFENGWGSLKQNYNERFHRMWTFYLLSCAASFRARKNQLWQIIYTKNGIPGGYQSIR